VISVDDWAEIRRLHGSDGMSIREIARQLRISRNTVRRALVAHEAPKYTRGAAVSIVDQVESLICLQLRDHPTMPATVIAERIGWTGSITVLRKRVRELRPAYLSPVPSPRTGDEPREPLQGGVAAEPRPAGPSAPIAGEQAFPEPPRRPKLFTSAAESCRTSSSKLTNPMATKDARAESVCVDESRLSRLMTQAEDLTRVSDPVASNGAYRAPARAASAPRLISATGTGRLNRTRLLQILYDVGPVSRAELARISEVTKTTIGAIVQPMLDEGILIEGPPQPSSVHGGKPARPLWFSPHGRPIVSVFLGPDTVRTALVRPTGTIVQQASARFSAVKLSHLAVIDCVASCIEQVVPTDRTAVLGVGVAVGGVVNTDEGRVVEVNLAPRLAGLRLGPLLSQRLGLPVHIDLHPRVQALGDRWFGSGRRISSFASVYCAEAIGVGFVIDGAVHRGTAGAGGEAGHTIVDFNGAVCRCGRRGCWETIATHRWLRSQALAIGLPGARSLTAGPLARLSAEDHAGARALLDRFARNLSVGLINLQQLLAPGLFILHGDVVEGGEELRALVERYVLEGVPSHPGGEPRVTFASTEDDMTMLGAAGLVLSQSLDLLA
jgi:predicted NBD/HSP70 family sugar kinase